MPFIVDVEIIVWADDADQAKEKVWDCKTLGDYEINAVPAAWSTDPFEDEEAS